MSEELDVFNKLAEAETIPDLSVPFTGNYELDQQILEHKAWLKSIRHEQPSPKHRYRVGIYIRYFNQTKHDNYLDFHIQQYKDTLSLLPNWELVDFYIDEGATAPNMESAKDWCRLLSDCFAGKVDLIVTQKVSNVSKKHYEITILARLLAALERPVGIYFVSEDIFTLASYYLHDNHDRELFPSEDWIPLPDDEAEERPLMIGGAVDV
ncbi:recombinase family protein [Intestinimonas massiliensis]|uniref:Recombinase family protein n=1 Tax=Intestinimonas massiliensis (ex Afouda et al. 2020) TaxID=1673721 RepID=A0AAW5JLV9_9FIRM|nr:recombinase family protein [Intestinimonas massiliensis (ex Afouda et al. 2020)]MCQ4770333.1 recombinase family protein [Intestinimonas massiliensis (ex Afouda et al. 2020)]